jgi:hypothetical protein
LDQLVTTVNDWMFAVATASVPILTFVVVMYLLIKLHFLGEAIAKFEAVHAQQNRDLLELQRAVAILQATVGRSPPTESHT